jgi:hypothetical protein
VITFGHAGGVLSEGSVWGSSLFALQSDLSPARRPSAPPKLDQADGRKHTRTRAADDFARVEELRRDREQAEGAEKQVPLEQIPVRVNRICRGAIAVSRSRRAAG